MEMQELKQLIYKGEKVDVECKEAENNVPKSAYESYSAFANTRGGYIILGVKEDKKKSSPEERFVIQGIKNPRKQIEDFWNTINGNKVNANILKDEDVFIPASNESSGRACTASWRMPRGSNTPLLCSVASLIPHCLQRGI